MSSARDSSSSPPSPPVSPGPLGVRLINQPPADPARDGQDPGPAAFTQAVALGYDPASDLPPHVLAVGQGFLAEQILRLAFAHGVKVRQDADLVQLLSAIDLDSDIPPEAFAAVAEILAYLYRANGGAAWAWEAAFPGLAMPGASAGALPALAAVPAPVTPDAGELPP